MKSFQARDSKSSFQKVYDAGEVDGLIDDYECDEAFNEERLRIKDEEIRELVKSLKSLTSGIGTPDDYEKADRLIIKYKGKL